MSMSPNLTLAELRALTDEELVVQHDRMIATANVMERGVTDYLAEILRREQAKQTAAIIAYTQTTAEYTKGMSEAIDETRRLTTVLLDHSRQINRMTKNIQWFTVINTLFVVIILTAREKFMV